MLNWIFDLLEYLSPTDSHTV